MIHTRTTNFLGVVREQNRHQLLKLFAVDWVKLNSDTVALVCVDINENIAYIIITKVCGLIILRSCEGRRCFLAIVYLQLFTTVHAELH